MNWKEKLIKVGKGAVIAAVGAALTYLSEAMLGWDYGEYTPVVVAGLSILVNAIRKSLPAPDPA